MRMLIQNIDFNLFMGAGNTEWYKADLLKYNASFVGELTEMDDVQEKPFVPLFKQLQ